MEVYEDDGPWIWVAFAPDSRLIVAFTIRPRKQYVADELVRLTDDCLSENKPIYITDGLDFYKIALYVSNKYFTFCIFCLFRYIKFFHVWHSNISVIYRI